MPKPKRDKPIRVRTVDPHKVLYQLNGESKKDWAARKERVLGLQAERRRLKALQPKQLSMLELLELSVKRVVTAKRSTEQ